jgi:hypothetical protein
MLVRGARRCRIYCKRLRNQLGKRDLDRVRRRFCRSGSTLGHILGRRNSAVWKFAVEAPTERDILSNILRLK